jgi:hypothetical protein
MSESEGWPVSVVLPGGQVVEGGLLARRRDGEGRWWYRVALDVPAAAVRPVDGHDYTTVPTDTADPVPASQWVLEALPHDREGHRALILHRPDCWSAKGRRLTPVADSKQVRVFVREKWATPCDVCTPDVPPA